jgi:hypothetical protein
LEADDRRNYKPIIGLSCGNVNFIRDIAPVAGLTRVALVLQVHPSFPAKSVPEFIAYAKANPGKITMASGGNGTPQHVSGELFGMSAGVSFLHVPYRGDAPAITDLLSGQVLARRFRQAYRRRNIKVGQGDPGRQHQGGLNSPLRLYRWSTRGSHFVRP